MLFRLPKPRHGWSEFVHEVIIVVIGVLLALAGAQFVDSLQWRSQVRDFRDAVDHELGRDLGVYARVMDQRLCVDRRLAELERFLADSSAGRQDKLLHPIGRPVMQSQYFSVWNNKSAEVVSHLPLKARIEYGEIYDEFENNDVVRTSEREVWRSLSQFDQPEPLDHSDRLRLRELLSRAEQLNAVTPGNYRYILNLTRPLGIPIIRDPTLSPLAKQDDAFCQPLLPK